jgi:DNA mismatch repair protein MutS
VAELSPMMRQYLNTKEEYPDCILFYRLGDFYEMFFDDAVLVSKELEITLTGKDCGLDERAPMCGVPYHALETYLNRLVALGYKVAIAEQVEDAKQAKGLVKREVIRVVTPGTIFNVSALEEGKNNYIMSVVYIGENFGIAISDITTGEFSVTEVSNERSLLDELNKLEPSEIICNEALFISGIDIADIKAKLGVTISSVEADYFIEDDCKSLISKHFGLEVLSREDIANAENTVIAAGALIKYLYNTQKNNLSHINVIKSYSIAEYMIIDSSTRRNLEIVETLREKNKRGTLLWVLDKTKTAMGARLLRNYIEKPLISKDAIIKRQEAIEELNMNFISREEICEYLNPIYDLERLIGRICYKTANPRDLTAFKNSLEMIPHIKNIIKGFHAPLLKEIENDMDSLTDLYELLNNGIVEEPPLAVKDGDIIKDGFNAEVDKLRSSKTEGKVWLSELEEREREKTGIRSMKVKFNKVFGYYLEVTNSFKDMVPDYFIRRQTLTNAERYTVPELKELEDIILGAEDKLNTLEYELFSEIRDRISDSVVRIQKTAEAIAGIDVFASLSVIATKNNYIKPKINEKGVVDIKNGRHPVIERVLNENLFVANDTYLDLSSNRVSIITGPNMAGKSTYMRQVALIVLMAQIGAFVPADSADIGICDRIFTRVGASDDLASGQSTFMVEMNEVANILKNATKNSLLILDEIGRGTSTFDGLSIAWAVVEHISSTKILGAKTLFATHYHELTELEGALSGVNNYCIAVKEKGDNIVFLRKIIKGGADKSYGIQVAKLAGVPDSVIQRAKELVEELSNADITIKAHEIANAGIGSKKIVNKKLDEVDLTQISIFDTVKDDDILKELKDMDLAIFTPIDALNTLYSLQNKLKNRW